MDEPMDQEEYVNGEEEETSNVEEEKPATRESSHITGFTAEQEDSFARFEKLLAKTENFSKCLSTGDVLLCKSFKTPQLKVKYLAPSAKKNIGRPKKPIDPADHRHRKTEKEEDEELLEQETKSSNVFMFHENPWYIKVNFWNKI
jgi:hypothetical protein